MARKNNAKIDILKDLNEKQRKAVTIINGPVLIIAGAGSGKTKALTHRIAYLISQGIKPENILAVTFTNKAAGEMKDRVKNLLRGNIFDKFPIISTFHSFCARILRDEIRLVGYSKDFVIFDENDQLSLMKKVTQNLQINTERFKPKTLLNAISDAKNELIDVKTYADSQEGFWGETTAKSYQAYQNELQKVNAVDFDDLIMLTTRIFQKYPEVLEKYQNQYKYILIDEYQDTNQAQYALSKMLAQKHKNICVVGDDWQCVYTWRKADFRNILNFERDWPDAKIIMLEENYRSTQNILDASHGIIAKNIYRTDKKLWTKAIKGCPIIVSAVYNEEMEGEFIINEIKKLMNNGNVVSAAAETASPFTLKDFVVLYRTNAQSRAIEEAMLKANLPYKIIGSIRFYSRKEIKDILAYLRLIVNPNDKISFQRIINVPARGIGQASLDRILSMPNLNLLDKKALTNSIILPPRSHKSLIHFVNILSQLLENIDKYKLTRLIKKLLAQINYENHIKDGTSEGESRWENVQELLTVAKKYDGLKKGVALKRFLEDVALASETDEIEAKKNLINLMTLHSVKGLEFPVVFIAGCEEGLLPHSKSWMDPIQLEEERRLCYVGVTRAKYLVYMIYAARRNLYGRAEANPPSRFIADIPEHLIDFRSQVMNLDDKTDETNDSIIELN